MYSKKIIKIGSVFAVIQTIRGTFLGTVYLNLEWNFRNFAPSKKIL